MADARPGRRRGSLPDLGRSPRATRPSASRIAEAYAAVPRRSGASQRCRKGVVAIVSGDEDRHGAASRIPPRAMQMFPQFDVLFDPPGRPPDGSSGGDGRRLRQRSLACARGVWQLVEPWTGGAFPDASGESGAIVSGGSAAESIPHGPAAGVRGRGADRRRHVAGDQERLLVPGVHFPDAAPCSPSCGRPWGFRAAHAVRRHRIGARRSRASRAARRWRADRGQVPAPGDPGAPARRRPRGSSAREGGLFAELLAAGWSTSSSSPFRPSVRRWTGDRRKALAEARDLRRRAAGAALGAPERRAPVPCANRCG